MPKPPKASANLDRNGTPLRVKVPGFYLDRSTQGHLKKWNQQGPSVGVVVDRLVSFALSEGFDPVTNSTR